MDLATLVGFVLAIVALLGTVLLEGGDPVAYLSPSAALIVLGGTFAATLVNFPLERVLQLPLLIKCALFAPRLDTVATIDSLVKMVERSRQKGLLSLEPLVEELPDPFMRRGIMLVVDGFQPDVVHSVLENEIVALEQRHRAGYSMLEAMGGFAPTMGIIGTVLGLVTVLSHLENPSELGHAIATAFIATLIGVSSANLVWLPLAGKLKQRSKDEVFLRELVMQGIAALQAGENPRMVRQKLEAYLAPGAKLAQASGSRAVKSEAAAEPA